MECADAQHQARSEAAAYLPQTRVADSQSTTVGAAASFLASPPAGAQDQALPIVLPIYPLQILQTKIIPESTLLPHPITRPPRKAPIKT